MKEITYHLVIVNNKYELIKSNSKIPLKTFNDRMLSMIYVKNILFKNKNKIKVIEHNIDGTVFHIWYN